MRPKRWPVTAALSLVAAAGCSAASRAPAAAARDEPAFARHRAAECSQGRPVDSAYVVRVAAEAFGPGGPRGLRPVDYQAVVAPGPVEEGVLVRLVPVRPTLGGGGLVFVDVETGCAIALRHYE